jgi:hypothetical protein
MLIAISTGKEAYSGDYSKPRSYLLDNSEYKRLLLSFTRTIRKLNQFWLFIKNKFPSYAERRAYIWQEFTPILNFLEEKNKARLDKKTSDALKEFESEGVHPAWHRALERRSNNHEGVITAARTLLETVCKYIIDKNNLE